MTRSDLHFPVGSTSFALGILLQRTGVGFQVLTAGNMESSIFRGATSSPLRECHINPRYIVTDLFNAWLDDGAVNTL
jgi:hypothetical protein